MPELAMAAPSCGQVQAVLVKQAQHGSHFHRMKVVVAIPWALATYLRRSTSFRLFNRS
jgi:hypothetical protein